MAEDTVRIGVIGVGGMGSGHCSMTPKIPGARLTAVCDTAPATLEKISRQHEVPGFNNHIDLLDSGLVDAVTIATPHYFHPVIAEDAFARGLHVLTEKPMSVTVSEADRMINASKKADRLLGVVYQMRTEARSRAARQIVESGMLGEVYRTLLVMGWYRSQAYYNSGSWRATWAGEGGGVLINQAPHYLDLFTWLAGLPTSVTGNTRTRLHDIEVEDEAFGLLEYANGAHGYLYASTTEVPQGNRIEICGDRGKLLLTDDSVKFYAIDGSIRDYTQNSREMWASPAVKEQDVEMPTEGEYRGHNAVIKNFVDAILHGTPLIADGQQGLPAVELINSLILSGHTNAKVSLPVDRGEYDALIAKLKASSHTDKVVVEQLVTDPKLV